MAELIPEVFINYAYVALSLLCLILVLRIYSHYKGSVQAKAYILLSLGLALDLAANIFWLVLGFYAGGTDNLPYPSFMDVMWLAYYSLFIIGVTYYGIQVWKTFNKGFPEDLLVYLSVALSITFIIAIPLLQSMDALFDVIVDPLYVSLSIGMGMSCIPLVNLFQRGKLMKPWLFFCLAGFSNAAAEISWITEFASSVSHDVSTIFYMLGYVLVIIAGLKIGASLKTSKAKN